MESQNKLILQHLREHKSITALDALGKFQCFRLAARIHDLREAGHRIDTINEKLTNKKSIGRYFLIKEASAGKN